MEDGGERWSKPYVATLSLHSLFELRSCIINSTVLLDMRANCIEEIAGTESETERGKDTVFTKFTTKSVHVQGFGSVYQHCLGSPFVVRCAEGMINSV